MNLTIRRATLDDIPTLRTLHADLHKDNAKYDTFLDLNWPMDHKGLVYFTKIIEEDASVLFIAEVEGLAVGYLAGGHKEMNYRMTSVSEIFSMTVSPQFQSNGIGERLVSEFRTWARDHGFAKVYVNVYFANERGIKFYKKCGLIPIDMSLEMDA